MFKLWAFHGYSLWSWGPSLLILLFLVFWGFFNCENCWIFSNVFSTFIEIITWFLDFILFTCYAYTYSFISSFDFSPRFQIAHSNIITQVSKRHLTLYIFKVELLIFLLKFCTSLYFAICLLNQWKLSVVSWSVYIKNFKVCILFNSNTFTLKIYPKELSEICKAFNARMFTKIYLFIYLLMDKMHIMNWAHCSAS